MSAEEKLVSLFGEMVATLKEFEPESGYLTATYREENGESTVRIYNDAFKNDNIKALDLWRDNPDIKKQAVKNINLDELPELHTEDEFFAMYDECVLQMAQLMNNPELLIWAAILKTKIKEGFK